MSTEIKPGQVWAWNDGRTGPGPEFNITSLGSYTGGTARVNYAYGGEADAFDLEADRIREFAHLVKDVDATPALLDPSKVKAGDTVTVTIAAMGDTPEFQITGPVYGEGYEGDGLVVGDYMLMHKRVTLTDHQPAPEPELVWEPGMVATADVWTDRTEQRLRVFRIPGAWVDEHGEIWHDEAPNRHVSEIVPRVAVDPAAVDVDALVAAAHTDSILYGDTTPDQMRRAALRMLAVLGIEKAR